MYDDVDFYSLPAAEQRRLINKKQVATSSGLLHEIPDGEPAVRVFRKSLEDLVLDRLEQGRYTIAELAEEFNVKDRDIRLIFHKLRRKGTSQFTGETSKYRLLTERNGVIRVKQADGPAFLYTLEKIPYFARVADPTLGISLLNIDDKMDQFPRLVEGVPAGKATQMDETYALLLGEFWDFEAQEIFDEITEFDRTYVETSLMPFPIVDSPDEFAQVTRRFQQNEELYKRFRDPHDTVERIGRDFMDLTERGSPGIRMYQVISIEFADLKWHAERHDSSLLGSIDDWIERIVETLYPDYEFGADDFSEQDLVSEDTEFSLEDEILILLSDDFETVQNIYDSLPDAVRAETTIEEVQKTLNRLASLGVISKKEDSDSPRYSEEPGSVSWNRTT